MITIIIIYLIGAVLAYGRSIASFYEIEEKYIDTIPVTSRETEGFTVIFTLSSWLGFIAGVAVYIAENEKYFFKFSYNNLRKKYNDTTKFVR